MLSSVSKKGLKSIENSCFLIWIYGNLCLIFAIASKKYECLQSSEVKINFQKKHLKSLVIKKMFHIFVTAKLINALRKNVFQIFVKTFGGYKKIVYLCSPLQIISLIKE